MLEKINQLAEQAATNVSRRQFLNRLGRGAMFTATVVGGLLALPGQAHAAAVCTPDSATGCVGKVEGQYCPAGTRSGVCVRTSGGRCGCVVKGPSRGGGRR
jgi:hypothetical protein